MSLSALPNDVLYMIVTHLVDMDLQNFLESFLGFAPKLQMREHAVRVPVCVREHWIGNVVFNAFKAHLHQLTERALFLSRGVTGTLVIPDWSPFAPKSAFKPLADYNWFRDVANVCVYDRELKTFIQTCYDRGLCVVRLSLHTYMFADDVFTVEPRMALHSVFHMFPPHLLTL